MSLLSKNPSAAGAEGFKPLVLPSRGEDLMPGRQYALTPLARLMIEDIYGIAGVPTIVECIRRKVPAQEVTISTKNLETGEVRVRTEVHEFQPESFRAFNAYKRILKFSFSVDLLVEREAMYADDARLSAYELSSEIDFGLQASAIIVRLQAGQTLAAKRHSTKSGQPAKPSARGPVKLDSEMLALLGLD